MAATKKSGSKAARLQQSIQRETDAKDAASGARKKARKPAQAGVEKYPTNPLPQRHLRKPGLEADLVPAPQFEATTYRGSGKLDGRVAIITGGDSGIGRAVAVLYAREGADVAIVYLPVEQTDAEETRDAVAEEGKRCLLIPGDVRDAKFCERAVERTVAELGHLDILVNNAAFQQHQKSIEEITDEQLERTFRTNIFGYFFMARAAVPNMRRGSAIVNTGSITGMQGSKELLDYSATKGAIHAFTKSLAQSLVEKEIRVNCVAPGPIWTPLNVADKEAKKAAEHGKATPMERPGQPEEVAPAYVFFASHADSSYITGEVLTLLGGETTAA
jgi:NAD(P)-dependent dehydrogenase (short-subunit alcohol dehydrogenase family)